MCVVLWFCFWLCVVWCGSMSLDGWMVGLGLEVVSARVYAFMYSFSCLIIYYFIHVSIHLCLYVFIYLTIYLIGV